MRLPPETKNLSGATYISDENAEKCRGKALFFKFFFRRPQNRPNRGVLACFETKSGWIATGHYWKAAM